MLLGLRTRRGGGMGVPEDLDARKERIQVIWPKQQTCHH
jgi:hypothetical protein